MVWRCLHNTGSLGLIFLCSSPIEGHNRSLQYWLSTQTVIIMVGRRHIPRGSLETGIFVFGRQKIPDDFAPSSLKGWPSLPLRVPGDVSAVPRPMCYSKSFKHMQSLLSLSEGGMACLSHTVYPTGLWVWQRTDARSQSQDMTGDLLGRQTSCFMRVISDFVFWEKKS